MFGCTDKQLRAILNAVKKSGRKWYNVAAIAKDLDFDLDNVVIPGVNYAVEQGWLTRRGNTGRYDFVQLTILGNQKLTNWTKNNDELKDDKHGPNEMKWDCFISYASEDRDTVVEPLVFELKKRNIRVWYDQWVLRIGDSLRRTIDRGLSTSRFGIVVLSPDFFCNEWPQKELDGLVQREVHGQKVILPIWHNVSHKDVAKYSPSLADKVAGSTSIGLPQLAEQLTKAMRSKEESPTLREQKLDSTSLSPVSVKVGYKELNTSTSSLHCYSLTVDLTLQVSPSQGRLRMTILWPKVVRIAKMSNIERKRETRVRGLQYIEFWLDYEHRIFPGQTVDIIGPESFAEVIYEFDDEIWDAIGEQPCDLILNVYFGDHGPIRERVPFSELNVF